jgi:hypothetical protein
MRLKGQVLVIIDAAANPAKAGIGRTVVENKGVFAAIFKPSRRVEKSPG